MYGIFNSDEPAMERIEFTAEAEHSYFRSGTCNQKGWAYKNIYYIDCAIFRPHNLICHSGKHHTPLHGVNLEVNPLPSLDVIIHTVYSTIMTIKFLFPPPLDTRKFLCGGSADLFWNDSENHHGHWMLLIVRVWPQFLCHYDNNRRCMLILTN